MPKPSVSESPINRAVRKYSKLTMPFSGTDSMRASWAVRSEYSVRSALAVVFQVRLSTGWAALPEPEASLPEAALCPLPDAAGWAGAEAPLPGAEGAPPSSSRTEGSVNTASPCTSFTTQ